jgi:hypothetical protein
MPKYVFALAAAASLAVVAVTPSSATPMMAGGALNMAAETASGVENITYYGYRGGNYGYRGYGNYGYRGGNYGYRNYGYGNYGYRGYNNYGYRNYGYGNYGYRGYNNYGYGNYGYRGY